MTHICIYRSKRAHAYYRARWGRKHGRPRGRGQKGWILLYRETFKLLPEDEDR